MKDPKLVAAGKRGAEKRWGPARVVRLDNLTPAQRRLVLALIEAVRESNQNPYLSAEPAKRAVAAYQAYSDD